MKKRNIKDLFTGFILGGVIFSGISVAAVTLKANQVTYTPNDSSFKVTNVEEAINEMYKLTSEFSSSELIELGGAGTYDLTSYNGYKNFVIGKNILIIPTTATLSGSMSAGPAAGNVSYSGSPVTDSLYNASYNDGVLKVTAKNLTTTGNVYDAYERIGSMTLTTSANLKVYLIP